MNLHLRKYVKEFLNEITRGRTGKQIAGHGKRRKDAERAIDDQEDVEAQGVVGMPEIDQSDVREGREVPVIIGIMNDLDAKRDELGLIDEETRPQKYFLGFCRPEFFDKYYDEALTADEKEDWNETFSADKFTGMANWSKTIVNLDIKFVYVKLSDIYEEFDVGTIEIKYDEARDELKTEINAIKKQALPIQREAKKKQREKSFKPGEAKAIFNQLGVYRQKIYELEEKLDRLKEDFKADVERINNDPDIQGSLQDLKGIRKTTFMQGEGQRRVSTTTKEVLRITLQKYGLAFIASEIITAELLDEERLINRLKSSFSTFRFYEGLTALGFTRTIGDEAAKDKLRHSGIGVRDNVDQFAVSSPEEADYYAALAAEEELDNYIKFTVIDDPEGRGLFSDEPLESVGSFAFAGYLKNIFKKSRYYSEYLKKIPDSIDDIDSIDDTFTPDKNAAVVDIPVPTSQVVLTQKEKDQEAFAEFIHVLRNSSLEESFVMFKTAICEYYEVTMNDTRAKDPHMINTEINVDNEGKITNLNDYDKAGVCRTIKSALDYKFKLVTFIAAREKKKEMLRAQGVADVKPNPKGKATTYGLHADPSLPARYDRRFGASRKEQAAALKARGRSGKKYNR